MTNVVKSPPFIAAQAAAEDGAADWGKLTLACIAQLGPSVDQARLGFVYVTDPLAGHLNDILTLLRQSTGIKTWSGSVGIGVIGPTAECFDRPAIAVMTAALPERSWHLLPAVSQPGEISQAPPWAQAARHEGAGPPVGVLHADPRNPRLPQLLSAVAGEVSGFLVGGLASARNTPDQVAGGVVRGGISGILFAPDIPIVTGISQGCSPIGPVRTVTAARENILFEIDDRPALEVFKEDIGEVLARRLERVAGYIHAAFPVAGSDTGDYLVRNLVGIDVERGLLAVGERVATGDRLLFVRRDRDAAEQDLVRMLQRVKRGLSGPPRGGLYFSCLARGPNLFGEESAELGILRRELGDFPLVGMFCNGEISNERLYGYTGVLALFA